MATGQDRITGLGPEDWGLDELVAHCVNVHIERMNNDHFFMEIRYPDGTSRALWLHSRSTIMVSTEERST